MAAKIVLTNLVEVSSISVQIVVIYLDVYCEQILLWERLSNVESYYAEKRPETLDANLLEMKN